MAPRSDFVDLVFPEELEAVRRAREQRSGASVNDAGPARDAIDRARRMRLFGLAFSGGGIRSATFNLGVLQALDESGLLKKVDYLSTVSGGGYIGGWLGGFIRKERGMPRLTGESKPERNDPKGTGETPGKARPEPEEVFFLRRFSNYLTPRLGLLSSDTLAVVMTYLRNLLLNLLILTSALAGALLLLRWIAGAGRWWLIGPTPPPLLFIAILTLVFLAQSVMIFGQLVRADEPGSMRGRMKDFRRIAPQVIVGITLVVSVFLTRLATMQLPQLDWYVWGAGGAVGYSAACFIGWVINRAKIRRLKAGAGPIQWELVEIPNIIILVLTAPFCGFLLGCLFQQFASGTIWLLDWWGLVALSPAVILGAIAVTGFLHVGLAGRGLTDQMREWWSRMGAWHIVAILGWTAAFLVALLPDLDILPSVGAYLAPAKIISAIGWLASTLAGVWAARSPRSGPGGTSPWIELVAKTAPYVFIAGLLILVAYFAAWIDAGTRALFPSGVGAAIAGVGLAGIALVLSWRVDVNEFSMLSMYRNRLARCYLGASNKDRAKDSTVLDPNDNKIPLNALSPPRPGTPPSDEGIYPGPYPLINTAINLVQTSELAWQERKASSFLLSPRFCGYTGADLQGNYRTTPDWLKLGTAMAISGAAVSPNMGYHTSKATAFLLTVFNARLGSWFPNPRTMDKLESSGPGLGLLYLFCELFGLTNDRRDYVYLSDGGHFENTGLYELLRRRCRFVIASDASADPSYSCEDISRAIARARTDLGVRIDLDLRPIAAGRGEGVHCVTGKITYPAHNGEEDEGTILYLKASLTGDESPDVESYAAGHDTFPHQTTADQFFDESQFESYRALGRHIAAGCLFRARGSDGDLENLFTRLREEWHSPLNVDRAKALDHSRNLDRIVAEISENSHLRYLDYQLFPEWPALTGRPAHDPRTYWLPADDAGLRDGFTVCSRMLRLMENVYHDLGLEDNAGHPDNGGWMNLFRHWTWSSMFRVTWAVTHSMHGARFRTFCERTLGLAAGRYANGRPIPVSRAVGTPGRPLNFVESRIVQRLVASGVVRRSDSVVPFHLVTEDPRDVRRSITFTYGFGIVRGPGRRGELVYVRIQDHLRRMGLARRAVVGLFAEGLAGRIISSAELERAGSARRQAAPEEDRVPEAEMTGESLDILERLVDAVAGKRSG